MPTKGRYRDYRHDDLLAGHISSLSALLTRVVSSELESRVGLSLIEWRVLALIGTSDNPTAQNVADETDIDKGWISRSVARLMERGLITRQTDARDARRQILSITTEGGKTFESGVETMRQLQGRLLDNFDADDHAALVRLATRLTRDAKAIADQQKAAMDGLATDRTPAGRPSATQNRRPA